MSKVFYLVEFTIESGKVNEFRELAKGFIGEVQASEAGTLGYQWYLAEDDSRCLIQETFESSEALLTHLGNVGPKLPALLAIAPLSRLEVFGPVSDDARGALATLGAIHFSHVAGFDR
ncbi:MAG: quinol monooxygenase YgiN [Rhodothermales bacterium]|jgi:quinol monooxygenase YgiN